MSKDWKRNQPVHHPQIPLDVVRPYAEIVLDWFSSPHRQISPVHGKMVFNRIGTRSKNICILFIRHIDKCWNYVIKCSLHALWWNSNDWGRHRSALLALAVLFVSVDPWVHWIFRICVPSLCVISNATKIISVQVGIHWSVRSFKADKSQVSLQRPINWTVSTIRSIHSFPTKLVSFVFEFTLSSLSAV